MKSVCGLIEEGARIMVRTKLWKLRSEVCKFELSDWNLTLFGELSGVLHLSNAGYPLHRDAGNIYISTGCPKNSWFPRTPCSNFGKSVNSKCLEIISVPY